MSAAFTPGPWEYTGPVHAVGKGVRAGKIADVSIAFKGSVERDANGFLIAAAPELYEALTEALFAIDSGQLTGSGAHAFADTLRPALAKARGETS